MMAARQPRGTTSSYGTLGPVIHSTYHYPTYGGVGTASGGLQGARRLAYDPGKPQFTRGGKGLIALDKLFAISKLVIIRLIVRDQCRNRREW